jgi:hypothetical protein
MMCLVEIFVVLGVCRSNQVVFLLAYPQLNPETPNLGLSVRELRDIGGYFGISVWNVSAISLGTDLA